MTDFSISPIDATVQPAGKSFGIRAGAYIVDSIILIITNYITSFVVGIFVGIVFAILRRSFIFDDEPSLFLNLGISIFLQTAYFTTFEWLYGASPGKVIFRMRVIKENGDRTDFSAALKRALYRYWDGFLFGLPAYNKMKSPLYQRYGDISADTVVVDSKDSAIQKQTPWYMFFAAAAIFLVLNATGTFIFILVSVR